MAASEREGYLLGATDSTRFRRRPIVTELVVLLAMSCLAASSAWGDVEETPGQPYPLTELEEAAAGPQPSLARLIDSETADEMPHRELDREEAGDLVESVFGALLETSAGPFADLQVEKFLSDRAALVAAPSSVSQSGLTVGGEPAAEEEVEQAEGPLLLDATVPLRTENDNGQERVVDLDLEPDEGELQAANPLIEVGIPDELGEGISIPSGSITLDTVEGAAERSPSILDDNVAFYPNVATDTDFAVATTPTGIETFTQLRSPDAPENQTLQLDLLAGAQLEADGKGGAVATVGGEETLKILPATAIDADGKNVPVSLEVVGDSLTLSVLQDASTEYPILVDPVIIESWPWNEQNTTIGMDSGNGTGTGDWRSWRNTTAFSATYNVPWSTPPSPLKMWMPGLNVTTGYSGTVSVGSQANWNYYVPRYFSDFEKYGTRPTSFIQNMQMWNLQYHAYSSQSSPWMAAGIWDEKAGTWVSLYTRNGTQGSIGSKYWSLLYNFPNGNYVQSAKNAGFGLLSSEAGANNGRILYAGYAALSLNDLTNPSIGQFYGPEGWVNDYPGEPITVLASDTGLGLWGLTAEPQGISSPPKWKAKQPGCAGTASEPCPRTFTFEEGSIGMVGSGGGLSEGVFYDPSVMPQGISYVKVTAEDVLGNKSASALVPVKVDHTAPSLALSGTMTQQASLGDQRPQYVLHLSGADGTGGSPQSGIATSTVKVNGQQVDSTSAGCPTQNCTLSRDWVLSSDAYSPGEHTVTTTVTDGAGIKTTKSLTINIEPDTTAPQLIAWGDLREAPAGWVEQVSKGIEAYAEDGNGYGVTSLSFTIDGKVVKSVSQSCPSGACEGELGTSVNMASYAGGAHEAEIVAEDGAGNISKEAWTINVNPSGSVPSVEAADTLEAADTTSESDVATVAPTSEVLDPAEIEAGNNPTLEAEGSDLMSSGTGADSSMSADAGDGFTINTGSETFHIEPTESSAGETSIEIANDVAGVAANTTSGVDTVVRPIYDGIMEFRSIRAGTAPETYSWEVQLHQGQMLKVIDEQHAGIYYPDETLALTITAESAHDATGNVVPTSLDVSETNVLTLTVHHQGGGFTYPVTAGQTWQTGYETFIVPGPPTKQEEEEEYWESAELSVSAPEPIPSGEASASTVGGSRKRFVRVMCGHTGFYSGGYIEECGNPFTGDKGIKVPWHVAIRGAFLYKPGKWAEHRGARACAQDAYQTSIVFTYTVDQAYECQYGPDTSDGNGGVKVSAGHYLRAQAHWSVGHYAICANECNGTPNPTQWEDKAIELHLWPSGAVQWAEP